MAGKKTSRGFHLLEVAIALSLFAITATIGASSTEQWLQSYRLRLATLNLVADARAARQDAVLHGCSVALVPAAEGGGWTRRQRGFISSRTELPPRVSVSGKSITFHPRGNAARAGSFRVQSGGRVNRVVVSVSGRVRWERLL